jgi:biopolymer transport protein ExbB/TolQ
VQVLYAGAAPTHQLRCISNQLSCSLRCIAGEDAFRRFKSDAQSRVTIAIEQLAIIEGTGWPGLVSKPRMGSTQETIQAVKRASERSSAVVHKDLKQGLSSLATIASIAPLVGVFGNMTGILSSFVGCAGEKSACMAATVERLSESIWPTAFGLMVGLISVWCYKYLSGRLEAFDREMKNASLELLNQLAIYGGRMKAGHAIRRASDSPIFRKRTLAELKEDQRSWHRSISMTAAALAMAWCIQVVRYLEHDLYPLDSASWTACWYLSYTFGISCIPAYPVWVRFLHRKPGGLAVLSSGLCLFWCIAELVFKVHLF